MPITATHGSPGVIGMAGFASGRNKYFRDQQRMALPLLAQQQRFRQDVMLQQQKYGMDLSLQQSEWGYREAAAEGQQKFLSDEAKTQREFDANLSLAGKKAGLVQAQWEHKWSEGRDKAEFEQRRQLAADDLQSRLNTRLDEGLMTGELYYSPDQKQRLAQLTAAATEVQTDQFLDPQQKQQALAQLRRQHDAVRMSPHSARGDQRAMPKEQRAQESYIVTEGGERLWTQPSGEQIQLRPEPSPEAQQAETQRESQERAQERIDAMEDKILEKRSDLMWETDPEGKPRYSSAQIGEMMAPFEQRAEERRQAYGLTAPGATSGTQTSGTHDVSRMDHGGLRQPTPQERAVIDRAVQAAQAGGEEGWKAMQFLNSLKQRGISWQQQP